MGYRIVADIVLVIHLLFVLFALLGGFLILLWHKAIWIHLPSAAWAVGVEFFGLICPLTHLENLFMSKAGLAGYQTSFLEHYLIPVLYFSSSSKITQVVLASLVLLVNTGVYLFVFHKIGIRKKNRIEP